MRFSGVPARKTCTHRPGMKKRKLAHTGVLTDFLLEVSSCRACLSRLARVARGLPEGEEYHQIKDAVGVLLNRLAALEETTVKWIPRSPS